MAYAKITFEHPTTGIIKTAPVGFSWTTLFFEPFAALFRGDITGAIILCLLAPLTVGLSCIIAPFIYNKLYVKKLLKKGYCVAQVQGSDIATLKRKLGINLPEK